MQKASIIVGALIVMLALGYSFFGKRSINPTESLTLGATVVRYQRADTDMLRTRGLSGTTELADGEGMLFIYDEPVLPRFWMKDMNYPIDIVWISSDMRVLAIEKNISPDTFPETFSPPALVQYVLEVPGGFMERSGTDIGTRVSI